MHDWTIANQIDAFKFDTTLDIAEVIHEFRKVRLSRSLFFQLCTFIQLKVPHFLEITLEDSGKLGLFELKLDLLIFLVHAVEESWERFEVYFWGEMKRIEFKNLGVETNIPSRVL